jgi:signal transduction histidine kinase
VTNEPATIPRAARRHLFTRIPTRGSGLGLAIAKAAVEANGGCIRFVDFGPPRVRVRIELGAVHAT